MMLVVMLMLALMLVMGAIGREGPGRCQTKRYCCQKNSYELAHICVLLVSVLSLPSVFPTDFSADK